MKKPLLIFIVLAFLLFVAAVNYDRYCRSKPDGCKQEKHEKDFGPKEGIDW